jgi:hypothetical protein
VAQRDVQSVGAASPALSEQQSAWQAPAASTGQAGSAAAAAGAAAKQTPMTAALTLMQKMEGVARLLGGALHAFLLRCLAWLRPCRPLLAADACCLPFCLLPACRGSLQAKTGLADGHLQHLRDGSLQGVVLL